MFNSYFVNYIKNLYTNKNYKKCCLIIHIFNNKKKNFMLMYLLKILKISQNISFCFAVISQDNNNYNIRFYIQDITQIYVEITLELNLNFFIQLLFKLISQLNIFFDSMIKIIRLLYSESEIDNHWFIIYYLHYKKKLKITEFAYNFFLFWLLLKLLLLNLALKSIIITK